MREKNVIDFYMFCHRLKNTLRGGWVTWHIDAERIESVAEHIYGTQMLAIAMKSEFEEFKDIDILKVIYMLAIHEMAETVTGDIPMNQISAEDLHKLEHETVHELFKTILDGEKIEKIWQEFDNQESKEAVFAHFCDKLECDIQARIYDETTKVDLTIQEDNPSYLRDIVKQTLEKYKDNKHSWSSYWIKLDQELLHYPKEFKEVSEYIFENEITNKD